MKLGMSQKNNDLGDKRRGAAVHLILGAVPGDAGEVGHVRVHHKHVASLYYHTKALTTRVEIAMFSVHII